jgi:hypothetical protein
LYLPLACSMSFSIKFLCPASEQTWVLLKGPSNHGYVFRFTIKDFQYSISRGDTFKASIFVLVVFAISLELCPLAQTQSFKLTPIGQSLPQIFATSLI